MLTNCTVTDKDGKVTDYIWDDQKKTMVEGRIEKKFLERSASSSRWIKGQIGSHHLCRSHR